MGDCQLDVVNCGTILVDGKNYRIQSHSSKGYRQPVSAQPTRPRYNEDEEEELEGDTTIVPDERSRGFKTCISADQELFGYIIGKQGTIKRKMEEETGATILIPRKPQAVAAPRGQKGSQSDTEIVVKADSRAAVAAARTRVELTIENALATARDSLPYTHVLSLPLANARVVETLATLKQQVLAEGAGAAAAGIEDSIFWDPAQLHLTLGMLKLYSAQKRQLAVQTLKALDLGSVLDGGPLTVRLRGLEYMNDDPSDVDVLYLKVEADGGDDTIAKVGDLVVRAFADAGLLLPQDEKPVKLHATIMNTRLRRSSEARKGFDARKVLEVHGEGLDLGEQVLDSVHLSQRGVFDDNGYYHCVAKAKL
uniref:K Homology domain-containing protein n=1 Tax=Pyramimonas obovata TaxID=1411642 RepID=A0A7S0WY86_9CHLO|mmetsp:Transcript_8546/g.17723  ORF Transcript_8546/g.17723 Transcript_8546/m.17723 type:complete len:366 (+) Transcript_8546:116-1213(+)